MQGKMYKKNKLDQQELIKPNDLSSSIIDSAPMSILATDVNGHIVFANKYFKQISVEYSPLGKSIFNMPFFIAQQLCDSYKKLLIEGVSFEKRSCVSMDGLKYLDIVSIPMTDSEGSIKGAFSMAMDITEAVKAKMELDKLNRELEEKVEDKTRELTEALKIKTSFISDASHELRTPLAIAKLNLELLKSQASPDTKVKKIFEAIDDEINKVSNILSDMAFFTTVDGGSFSSFKMEKVNLNDLLLNSTRSLEVIAEEKSITVFLKEGNNKTFVLGDKNKLHKLFVSIIANSIKYCKKKGWIRVSLKADTKNKLVKIIISDNGIGINKKDLPHIFDRFYRSQASRKNGSGGLGLGLSVAKWIVDRHNGTISVKSSPGKGTVFNVVLPIS
ncbi:MAG: PAS domain-containing sensor histidine kinase [Candidatus Staskawiczbacteria bacterium]|nr:PAS domain-containing sensor histidine kinase [Candidatus Staskawiczbacteria bacterium]